METIKNYKKLILMLVDIVLINASFLLAFYIKFTYNIPSFHLVNYKRSCIAITIIYLIALSIFKLYKSLWKYASIDEFLMAIGGCITGGALALAYGKVVGPRLPYSVSILAGIFSIILIVGFRISFRIYRRAIINLNNKNNSNFQKIMIVGAGYSGNMIINEMKLHNEMKYKPVVAIDDNKSKIGSMLSGVPVVGDRNHIASAVLLYDIDIILIAIPSIDNEDKEELINICKNTKCKLKILPGICDLISQKSTLSQIRDVNVEDLLGREQIELDMNGISDYIQDKTVLVTGGGGSIGSELCRQIAKFKPKVLLILDIYENNVYDLENELKCIFPELNYKVIIASVRDKMRIENIFEKYKPEVVFHAAAHKHVPLMEDNPDEAVKNNVFGTLNIAGCSDKYKVKRFILISSDKAVNPTNVMGATKRICEMIIQSIDKVSKTEFVAVRFGNVLGSNGSVIPLFKRQIERGGPVTVTHKEITRFFMTIPEAAQLVLQAGAYAKGGEIFVLDMGKSVKIYDLACDLIRLSGLEPNKDIQIKITGIRPGEKLYEEVLMNEEKLEHTLHNKIYIGQPLRMEYKELVKYLIELYRIIDSQNSIEIISSLKKLVPTYIDNSMDEVAVTSEVNYKTNSYEFEDTGN
jgi:FlaA1/EpsC-like NDP-sugar epimerase